MATIFKSTGHAQFDKLLEKATSNLLLEPEWAAIIQICDLIRQKDCQPKYALAQVKKKLHHSNPHVSFYALQVLESVVKNCGSPIHEEIASKQFMEELKDLAKTTHHDNIRDKILELIQTWAHAFRKISSYRAVQDVLNIMKTEGAKFPPLVETDAMFVADQAPEWADGECCHRCRVEFSFTQRKHHCRACGQIFCHKCSSKECTLPKFGIEKEVRVCDSCFEKYGREGGSSAASSASGNSSSIDEHVHTTSNRASNGVSKQGSGGSEKPQPTQKELELAEEEQLQLALAISQSEAEAKEQELKKRNQRAYSSVKQETARTTSPPPTSQASSQDDPELSRYLNRAYWENKSNTASSPTPQQTQEKQPVSSSFMPSAPLKLSSTIGPVSAFQQEIPQPTTNSIIPMKPVSEEDQTVDVFLDTLRTQIEMFVNRMKSNSSRGRPIANDTSVQSLFMSITHMHSQLLAYIQTQDDARARFELLQDKLNQVRDARAALDDLRNEHAEEIRRQQEEQERIRAYQMAQKLALMRQKKNEYLQYQRQLAMQRMQEQEREMQMRIAQQGSIGVHPGGGQPGQQPGQMAPWGVHPGYQHMVQQPQQGGPPMSMYQSPQPQPPQQQQWMNNQQSAPLPQGPQQPQGQPQQQIPVLNSPTNSNHQMGVQQQQPGMMYGPPPGSDGSNQQQQQPMQMPSQQQQPDPNMMMAQQPPPQQQGNPVQQQHQQPQQIPPQHPPNPPQVLPEQQQVMSPPMSPPQSVAELISFD